MSFSVFESYVCLGIGQENQKNQVHLKGPAVKFAQQLSS